MLYKDPCVFAVGNDYEIAFNTTSFGIAWVEVGEKKYMSASGGLMISETLIHKVTVPMKALDEAKGYRVCFRALPERKPYFPELQALETRTYTFRPIDQTRPVRAYMLADTHSRVDEPTRAAQAFGEIDLLILAGDIPAESKTYEDIRAIYDLTSNCTRGEIPVIFARGNHDYRGRLATELTRYIGTRNQNTFFTFRLGSLWGIVLDCGEDKNDDHIEYGGLIDCHNMRLAETEFLKDVIARAGEEYLAPGVTTRIAISHLPFMLKEIEDGHPDFNIETGIFSEWTDLLNQMQLDFMLSGHMHRLSAHKVNAETLRMNARFPVVVGSAVYTGKTACPFPAHENATFLCTGMTFSENEIQFVVTDDNGHSSEFFRLSK